ncbi:Rrf2 family transcriptional regulator [Xanthobacteraceae bacterium Astr-EGSB]|uniref:RrF2 family transcriptional regulator n=1 Tax=Astrobacterium formosum TaxID=3069710 RepID=UPI0027B698E8|nr:Rrf2 family transcriptional regulator [Xanthobacteraceae bacterium Astr-EGSB]
MSMLANKVLLAIAVVVDVGINSRERPVSAKALAERHGLSPRHLEPFLQTLVRNGFLRGVRGPGGGYELARDAKQIFVDEIITATESDDAEPDEPLIAARFFHQAVRPALAVAEQKFLDALAKVSVADMVRRTKATDCTPSDA